MIPPFKVQVRFADVDSMGHVNNAIYLSYFETARMHYLNALLGEDWDWLNNGIILLKNEVEYKKPVLLRDQPEIEVNVDKIGNKSFSLTYDLKVNGQTHSWGISYLVAYNYNKKEFPCLTRLMI